MIVKEKYCRLISLLWVSAPVYVASTQNSHEFVQVPALCVVGGGNLTAAVHLRQNILSSRGSIKKNMLTSKFLKFNF